MRRNIMYFKGCVKELSIWKSDPWLFSPFETSEQKFLKLSVKLSVQ